MAPVDVAFGQDGSTPGTQPAKALPRPGEVLRLIYKATSPSSGAQANDLSARAWILFFAGTELRKALEMVCLIFITYLLVALVT